jgi:hypothetical protein
MKEIHAAANEFDKEKASVGAPSKMAPSTVVGMIGVSVDEVLMNKAIGINVVRSEQQSRSAGGQFQHCNLWVEWGKAMEYPIGLIKECFKQLKLQGRPPVSVLKDRVSNEPALKAAVSGCKLCSKRICLPTKWKDCTMLESR